MKRTMELLAPGGDIDAIKAAIAAGANAVYCGLDKFNARNRATNISIDDLNAILRLAHENGCRVFLTLNIIIVESEIAALVSLLNKVINTSIDGIIVQDLGILYLLSRYFKRLPVHASTQLTTHNGGQVMFLRELAVSRVNLARELSIAEIKALAYVAHENNIAVEVFVHGSLCICFSGLCYMSSVLGGNSGNRGRCSQSCRDEYAVTARGKYFPLNLKDNSAYHDVRELHDAGVDSLKIEGRIKKAHYVFTIVDAWRKQLDMFIASDKLSGDNSALYKVFNRDFTNGYLKGIISRDMFIDNPRDNSAIYVSATYGCSTGEDIEKAKGDVYDERTGIIARVESELAGMNAGEVSLNIRLSGKCGEPLNVEVCSASTSFIVTSGVNLSRVGTQALDHALVMSRFKALNHTGYFIEHITVEDLQPGVFLPFKELTAIKKKLISLLNGSGEYVDNVEIPAIHKIDDNGVRPSLSILISSPGDIHLCNETAATVFFQLPGCLGKNVGDYIDVFSTNDKLVPWFPPVLIGDDFTAALQVLDGVHPRRIVTNNTGIAHEANKRGIAWIAGPQLNIANSFSLLCLKEQFNCSGAFISNELSKIQVKGIKKTAGLDLFYSIYHPILLMTSRQCLFHQVDGCGKDCIDENCMEQCERTMHITNIKGIRFVIEKSRRNYHDIYNDRNFMNPAIITDIPGMFSSFMIDLREIRTGTTVPAGKAGIIKLFEKLLEGNENAKYEIERGIRPTTNEQYKRGI